MVSLTRASSAQQAQVYFQMFRRQNGSGNYSNSGNSGLDGCLRCHPNGLRAISPLGFHVRGNEKQLPEDTWNAVKAMNEAMDDYTGAKLVSWRGAANGLPFIKPEANWPIVGPLRPTNPISRTQAFIIGGTLPDGSTTPGCYKSRQTVEVLDIFGRPPGSTNVFTLSATPIKDWTKVRNAMLCETCHNNRQRYAINARTDGPTIDYKILVDQSMPVGMHQNPLDRGDPALPATDRLTPDERIGLANCLIEEMALERPLLGKWLTQETCQ